MWGGTPGFPVRPLLNSLSLCVWVRYADLIPFLVCELAKGRAWIPFFAGSPGSARLGGAVQMLDGYKNGQESIVAALLPLSVMGGKKRSDRASLSLALYEL